MASHGERTSYDIDSGDILLSTDVSIAGVDLVAAADDEDVLMYSSGTLSVRFDLGAMGFPSANDLDGLHFNGVIFDDGFESGDTSMWSSTVP